MEPPGSPAMHVESVDDADLPGRITSMNRTCSPPGVPSPKLSSEFLRLEARLDRISEQVDACLAEIVAGKPTTPTPAPKPVLQRQASSLSKASKASKGDTAASARSRRNMVPFKFWDRAETVDLEESKPERPVFDRSFSGVFVEEEPPGIPKDHVPLRPNRRGGPASSRDIRLASQIVDFSPDEVPEEDRPMLRLLHRHRCDTVWELLEDPHSSRGAWWISQTLKALVIGSVTVTILQVSEEPVLEGLTAALVETGFDLIFLLEFLCRIFSAPSKKEYLKDPLNWADLASASGLPLRLSIGFILVKNQEPARQVVQAILLFILPMTRFLKLLRYFETIRLLVDAFRKSLEALPVLMYTMALIVLASTYALYLSETRSNIPSIQHSLWLCVVTMTTVGYGDYAPKSLGGFIIMSILTIVSVLFLAMPVGIIGNEFTICWQGRAQVLSVSRVQKALSKWGFSMDDVRALFDFVDEDMDGKLSFSEFFGLLTEMRIGLHSDTILTLFGMFDTDQSGHLNYMEFLHGVFPLELFEEDRSELQRAHRKSSKKVCDALARLDLGPEYGNKTLDSVAEINE